MDTTRNLDKEYLEWIAELSQRYRQSQIKAAVKVNSEMLRFYWTIGKDITDRQYDNKYGAHFYENLSRDLSLALNKKKGFSPTNLKYAKYFYILYSPMFPNRQQLVDESKKANLQQVVGESSNTNRPQLADDFEKILCIPWGHHVQIIGKCSDNPPKALFFVRKTLENQWGRSVLMNFLATDLYESQGAALTNFATTLPTPESDLAQDYFKDPYHFEFLHMNEEYTEKDLKDDLMNKLVQFLIELGKGFSFVGREYRLSAGISEYEVAKQQLPQELQDKLPSVEEIEQRLKAAI